MPHRRRGSIVPGTSPATSLFNRRDSVAAAVTPPTAMYATGDPQRDRRFSVSAALGLANFRRSSTSTTAEESAIEDDASPISRRMSMQPTRAYGGMSGGSPTSDQVPYDWSANLRARAQSSVGGIRPVFGLMPQSDDSAPTSRVSPKQQAPAYMAPPPSQPPAPKLTTRESRKPDAYQERILKGDFYMD